MSKNEKLAKAIWEFYYPDGGSVYKTYESLSYHDKEELIKEAEMFASALSGQSKIVGVK